VKKIILGGVVTRQVTNNQNIPTLPRLMKAFTSHKEAFLDE
jgi:hypothetical protein